MYESYFYLTADAIQNEEQQKRFSERYPGWKPEDGTTPYGYPLPPDMSHMTDADVRTWGKTAWRLWWEADADFESGLLCQWRRQLRNEVDADRMRLWEEHKRIIDVRLWFGRVGGVVCERLGTGDDPELAAYEDRAYVDARNLYGLRIGPFDDEMEDKEDTVQTVASRAKCEWLLYQVEKRCLACEFNKPNDKVSVYVDHAHDEEMIVHALHLRDRAEQVTDEDELAKKAVPDGWRLLGVWREF